MTTTGTPSAEAATETPPSLVRPPAVAAATPRWPGRALPALVAAGAVFQVAQYLSRRSFWEDESFVVLNIRDKTAAQLMGALDYSQAAPPLFLLTERVAAVAWGASEFALRLLPLGCSLIALGLMAVVARRVARGLGGPDTSGVPSRFVTLAVLAAVGLFATSDRLIWRAAEVKPYAGDALAALVLTAMALAGASGTPAAARLARTSAAAAVLVWFSFPTVLVFAGIALALLPAVAWGQSSTAAADGPGDPRARPRRLSWRGAGIYLACTLPVAVSFVVLHQTVVLRQRSTDLETFWAEHFADVTRPLAFAVWLARHLFDLCNSAAEPLGPVVLGLLVVGVIALARGRRWETLGVVVLPGVVAVAAAAAGRYPFDGKRLTTFLVPGVLALAGVGFAAVAAAAAARRGPLGGGVAAGGRPASDDPQYLGDRRTGMLLLVLLAVPLVQCLYSLAFPRTRAHVRPAVEFVAARYEQGDAIYCDPNACQFLCYWPPPALGGEVPAAGAPPAAVPPAAVPVSLKRLGEPATAGPAGRFWVVIAHSPGHGRRLEGLLATARAAGVLRDRFEGYGGAAYLFEAAGGDTRAMREAKSPAPR
jgi:hypothetical protein